MNRRYRAGKNGDSYAAGILLVTVIIALSSLFLFTSCGHGDENEVRVFSYGDYIDPDIIDRFEEETGIDVVYDTFDTNEEMYPVIKNRAGVYDVICPSDYMVERLVAEGLLAEIDHGKIQNLKNIDKTYLKIAAESFDPGNKYAVPYQWGTAGIMYNTSKIEEGSIDSWADLWKEEYSGKIIMQDSLRDTLGVGLKSTGHSLNSVKESELSAATDHLIDQKKLVYKYANDSARDFLIGNSADLGVVWNGELLYSRELNPDLDFVIPEEGTEVFFDNWCIPYNAFHAENAHKWIDYMCRADVAYANYEYLTYATPNKAARDMMPDEVKNDPRLYPSDEILKKCETLRDVGPEGDELYSKYWKIFKSN